MMHRPNSRPTDIGIFAIVVAISVILPAAPGRADPVEDLVTFSAGTTARADEVNANFGEVADSVNDNDARIAELEAEIAGLQGAVDAAEATIAALQASLQSVVEAANGCPTLDPSDEMIRVGDVCIDKYEASIWDAPVGGNQIIATTAYDYCNPNGQDCTEIYARSVAGVEPAIGMTWFQAQQALANSGKRLPTNAEWQRAVAGTPDHPGPCNTDFGTPLALTGSSEGMDAECVSSHGAFDMVGNLWEWAADWVPRSGFCVGNGWPAGYGGDYQTLCGISENHGGPGALLRGGHYSYHTYAGPFAVIGEYEPTDSEGIIGFRGAR